MPSRAEQRDPVLVARRRFARRQWARRWLAWRVLLGALVVVGAVAGGIWLVMFSSVLSVHGVRVEGAEVLDPREVRAVAAVPTGSPLATVDLEAIRERVERLTPVEDVDVVVDQRTGMTQPQPVTLTHAATAALSAALPALREALAQEIESQTIPHALAHVPALGWSMGRDDAARIVRGEA